MDKIFYELYGIKIVVKNMLPEQIYYQCEEKFLERLEILEKEINKIKFDKELVDDYKNEMEKEIEYDDPKNFYKAVEASCSDSISGSYLGESEY